MEYKGNYPGPFCIIFGYEFVCSDAKCRSWIIISVWLRNVKLVMNFLNRVVPKNKKLRRSPVISGILVGIRLFRGQKNWTLTDSCVRYALGVAILRRGIPWLPVVRRIFRDLLSLSMKRRENTCFRPRLTTLNNAKKQSHRYIIQFYFLVLIF